jgi:predicted ATPase
LEAKRHAEQVASLSNEQRFPFWLAWGMIFHGAAIAVLGQAEQGRDLIEKGLSVCRTAGAVVSTPFALILLGDVCAGIGQPAAGLTCLANAAEIISLTDERYVETEWHRVQGTLIAMMGQHAAGEKQYFDALTVARKQSTKTLELRAATSLARLWRDQGKCVEA